MPTQNLVARVPSDLREAAQDRADQEHRNLTEVVKSALRAYLTGDDGGEARNHMVRRIAELEAELESARAELERAKQGVIKNRATELEKRARAELTEGKDARYAAAFQAATKDDPATAPRLAAMSGFSRYWSRDLARALERAGYTEAVGPGRWIAAPGKDIAEGLPEAKALAQHGAARIAPSKREAPDGSSPAPVPPVAPGEATQAAEGKSAATGNGAITGARERAAAVGAPLVAAKDLPRPGAAVFQPPGEGKTTVTVPEVQPGKPRGSRQKRCDHRLPAGAWCKTCQQPK